MDSLFYTNSNLWESVDHFFFCILILRYEVQSLIAFIFNDAIKLQCDAVLNMRIPEQRVGVEFFTWWKTISASFTDGLQESRLLYVTTDNEIFKAFISTINFLASSILPHFPYEYIIRLNSFWSGSMKSSALKVKYILSASSCFPIYYRNQEKNMYKQEFRNKMKM